MTDKNVEFRIAIRCPCNYSCHYCVGQNQRQPVELFPLEKIQSIYDEVDAFTVTSFECGAGEPSIHPQITELIRIALTKGAVSIPSNNSRDPALWLPENSKGVMVRAALHPQSEENLEAFIDRLLKIRERGAIPRVEFVAHPERMPKIDEYIELFAKYNIKMVVNGFSGTYNDKKYPDDYTDEEKKKIGLVHTSWYARINLDITDRNFFGLPCLAGFSSIYIDPSGEFHRCLYDKAVLEHVYESSRPCRVNWCGCGLLLEELNNQDIYFWNNWRSLYGAPLLPKPEPKTDEEQYIEKKEIYKKLRGIE